MGAGELEAFTATLVAAPTPVSIEEAAELAWTRYGLKATATRLTGERDENFRLTCPDGAQYVLKIANTAEDPIVTDLPTAALLHLERVDPDFPCPRVLRDLDRRTQSRYEDRSGAQRTLRILTFLSGTVLRSAPHSRERRAACGRLGARLGVAFRGFTHPAASRPLIWDLRHVGKALLLLPELPDLPARAAIAALLRAVDARIAQGFESLRQQTIHNDLNDLNLLVDARDGSRIVGVIDFGDLAQTALVADVAIMASYQIAPDEPARNSIADIVMAYHQTTPLRPEELAMLNPLIAGRILTDVVIPAWHRRR
ncbi:MAG TPA: phosphotransferase, partial [Steroidobacteraceae bacterium]|nr:phosphotransferase [Steroidobacteraceae bacterium]